MSHDWRDKAACRTLDTAIFFTDSVEKTHAAMLHCLYCPVREQCLRAADKEEKGESRTTVFGIRGGLTAKLRYERRVQSGAVQVKPRKPRPTLDYGKRWS